MEMFQRYFIDLLKNHYADFNGRARRKEFWMFFLFYNIIFIVLYILTIVGFHITNALGYIFAALIFIYAAGMMVPVIAVGIRRLHDIGKPGVWWLVNFIPFVGGLVYIYFCVLDSQPGANAFGPNPKEDEMNQPASAAVM